MKYLKLGTKILSVGLLLIALPILIIGVVSVYESSRNISKMGREDMISIAESLAGAVGISMAEQLMTVRNISYSNSVIAAAEKVAREGEKNSQNEIVFVQKELTKMKDAEGDRFSSILLVGKNGIAFASSESGKIRGLNLSGRDYLDKAFKGTPNVGAVVVSRAHGRVICTAANPIYASTGKEITGVVVIGMELKFLTDIFDMLKVGKGGYPAIIDRNGLSVYNPARKEGILKANINQNKGMEAFAQQINRQRRGIGEYVLENVHKTAAFAPVEITDWSVVVTIPSKEFTAPVSFIRNLIIIVGLISLILASLFFYLFSRTISSPLNSVVDAAQQIA